MEEVELAAQEVRPEVALVEEVASFLPVASLAVALVAQVEPSCLDPLAEMGIAASAASSAAES